MNIVSPKQHVYERVYTGNKYAIMTHTNTQSTVFIMSLLVSRPTPSPLPLPPDVLLCTTVSLFPCHRVLVLRTFRRKHVHTKAYYTAPGKTANEEVCTIRCA